ncbi:MAG: cysteine--tRNA ligase [Candidatus Margulisiibacteriota bacterium]
MKVFNSLTRQKEEFQTLEPDKVKMYVCGVTPYDECHLGHGRAYVTFDIIRRYLEFSGYQVTHIQNFTDIDDKIIKKSNELGAPSSELTEKYIASYFEVMDKLNIKRATNYPKATEHIPEMIKWIGGLVDGGYAYLLEDGVYFEVEKFAGYGKLSGRKMSDQEAGARVKADENKKSPLDFALWKKAKAGEPSWESPWGAGRPGWHIECSVMSTKYLGEQFDIHGGGLDLEFPHHENEIAQTEALTGKVPWVKYWLHNGFVTTNKEKMSKSLGNFFTLRDIFQKFEPMAVRFFLLLTHYRGPINFSETEVTAAREGFEKLRQFIAKLDFLLTKSTTAGEMVIEIEDLDEELQPYRDKFKAFMDDDFNTAGAIAAIFEMIAYCYHALDDGEMEKDCLSLMRETTIKLCDVLGLVVEIEDVTKRPGVKEKVDAWDRARAAKDYKTADAIRAELSIIGIAVSATGQGTMTAAITSFVQGGTTLIKNSNKK